MNAVAQIAAAKDRLVDQPQLEPLEMLREPFPDNQISKLPKETGAQAKQRKTDQDAGKWPAICKVCGGRHHANAVHLDYVGHAATTDRLLDADLKWSWEPLALTPAGLPAFDTNGGLWIKLTVDGVTRIGYGAADGKTGGDAIKEIIGDALRNAGMRFGMALDLWHKGVLHADDEVQEAPRQTSSALEMATNLLRGCGAPELFKDAWAKNFEGWRKVMSEDDYRRVQTVKAEMVAKFVAEAETAKAAEKPKEDFTRGGGGSSGHNTPFDDEIPFITRWSDR